MGRYWIVLIALAAVFCGLAWAQDDDDENGQAGEAEMPSVMADDQQLTDESVTVAMAVIDEPGWVAIHNVIDGRLGGTVGVASIDAGTNTDVMVEISPALATMNLVAELHYDRGQEGCFEYPGPDEVVMVNGMPVIDPFTITMSPQMQTQIMQEQQQVQQQMQNMTGMENMTGNQTGQGMMA